MSETQKVDPEKSSVSANVFSFTHRFFFSPIAAGTAIGFASAMMILLGSVGVAGECRESSLARVELDFGSCWFESFVRRRGTTKTELEKTVILESERARIHVEPGTFSTSNQNEGAAGAGSTFWRTSRPLKKTWISSRNSPVSCMHETPKRQGS